MKFYLHYQHNIIYQKQISKHTHKLNETVTILHMHCYNIGNLICWLTLSTIVCSLVRSAGHIEAVVGNLVERDSLVVGSPVVGSLVVGSLVVGSLVVDSLVAGSLAVCTLLVDSPHFVYNPVEGSQLVENWQCSQLVEGAQIL